MTFQGRTHDFSRSTHDFSRVTHDFSRVTHDFSRSTHDFLRVTHDFSRSTHDFLRSTHDFLRSDLNFSGSARLFRLPQDGSRSIQRRNERRPLSHDGRQMRRDDRPQALPEQLSAPGGSRAGFVQRLNLGGANPARLPPETCVRLAARRAVLARRPRQRERTAAPVANAHHSPPLSPPPRRR